MRRWVVCLAALAALAIPSAASAAETTHTLSVPTGTVGAYEVKQGIMEVPKPPGGGFITKMETDIVDASTGEPVPISRLMLHHIVFVNVFKPDNTCNSLTGFDGRLAFSGIGLQRFYAAGEERAKLALPPGYGYPVDAGDRWAITYMLMNHRSVPDNAMIQYKVTVESDPVTPVEPHWLDVRDCRADPIYNVPGTKKKGSTHTESRDYVLGQGRRIVAGAGHVHGGARNLTLTKPDCGDAQIASSEPTWGQPDHPFYNVRPVLHEPGPISMTAFQTPTGIPVAPGERVRLSSRYDNSRPHTRVMGIFVIYTAPDPGLTQACGSPPADVSTLGTSQAGRGGPIRFKVPLTRLNRRGEAITVRKPPGELKETQSGSVTTVRDRSFSRPNIEIERGSRLKWSFAGFELHNLTLANGPVGIGTDNLDGLRVFKKRFAREGTYRFFCSLHPVQMHQRVVVTRKQKDESASYWLRMKGSASETRA